jgi:hypothetical protein
MLRLVLEEDYVEHVQKSLAHAAIAADEAVSQQKKTIDVEETNDLSILIRIGHEIILLLKFIWIY